MNLRVVSFLQAQALSMNLRVVTFLQAHSISSLLKHGMCLVIVSTADSPFKGPLCDLQPSWNLLALMS
jgi:hypothetical protein